MKQVKFFSDGINTYELKGEAVPKEAVRDAINQAISDGTLEAYDDTEIKKQIQNIENKFVNKDFLRNFNGINIWEPIIINIKCYGFTENDYLGLTWLRRGYTGGSIVNGIAFYYYLDNGNMSKEAVKVSLKNEPSGIHTHVLTISKSKFIVITINWDNVPRGENNYVSDNTAIVSIQNLIQTEYDRPVFSVDINNSIFEQYVKNVRIYTKSSSTDKFYLLQIKNDVLDTTDSLYKSKVQITDGNNTYLWEDFSEEASHTGIETLDLKDKNGVYSGYITIDWDLFYYNNGNCNYGGQTIYTANIKSSNVYYVYPSSQCISFERKLKVDKPILTIIDDDGYTSFLTEIKSVCDELGVKCSAAIITSKIGSDSTYMTLDDLQTLYSNGFDLLSHSYSHNPDVFNNNTADLTTVADSEISEEYQKSFNDLKSWGYPTETIVYPWGGFGEQGQTKRYTNLAKNIYQFGVTSGGGVMNDEVLNTYWLYREFVFETKGLSYYTNLIDGIKNNKGWLILGTHSGREQFSTDFLKSIVQYAINNGVDVMTFKEANEIKRNIVSFGNYGEKSNSIYIGRNGVLKII